jgi:hypothetical protein
LGGSVHTVKGNTVSLVADSKETGRDVNADKTKYTVMSGDQNAGRSYRIKVKVKGREAEVYSALQLEEADCILTP